MSSSHPLRRNTVHDLAALRLHPDGSRVPPNPHPAETAHILHPRLSHYTAKDARGNWIARDAAGLGTVKKKRKAVADETAEEDAEVREGLDEGGEGQGQSVAEEGDEGGPRTKSGRRRAEKRRRFESDLDFLTGGSDGVVPEAAHKTLPVPSSDFLKCIHHFASTYYASQDQLFNATREYRAQKKLRRLSRMRGDSADIKGKKRQENDEDEDEKDEDDSEDDDADEEEHDEGEEGDESMFRRRKRSFRSRSELRRDMYKMFDGSALMAIGILLQEHVAGLLEPRIPPDWDGDEAMTSEEGENSGSKGSNGEEEGAGDEDEGEDGDDQDEGSEDT
ncbi:hypothetical protein EWM64_g8343 [Hericium alpestre]|uniref:Uncharacterized protein n=1 Tax=Hericium alpestre TaxID=135208 RepID=A0A4Y9ZN32_9AGAM|nr:hypothetical protein EWM64_g8343 [Hericium alpestre]